MGAATENDAVLVDQIDLASGMDLTEDLGRVTGGVGDFVEGNPLPSVFLAGGLVEGDGGLFADVEGLPIEERLLFGLLDGDLSLAVFDGLDGVFGSGPFRGVGGGLEATGDETVRNLWKRDGDIVRVFAEVVGPVFKGGVSRSVLHRAHGVEGAVGAGEGVFSVSARCISGCRSGCAGSGATGFVNASAAATQNVASVDVKTAD